MIKVLVFEVSNQFFALNSMEVLEILRANKITPIPNSGNNILGVTKIRESILNVFDTANVLGIKKDINTRDYFIMVELNGDKAVLTADNIISIAEVNEEDFLSHNLDTTPIIKNIYSIDKELVMLLDLDKF